MVLAAIAVAVDLALRTRFDGLAGGVLVLVLAAGLLGSRRLRNWQTKLAVVLLLPFAGCLLLRTSGWVVPLDGLAIALLCFVAAVFSRGGDLFDLPLRSLVTRAANALVGAVMAPAFVCGSVAAALPATSESRRRRRVAIARGLGLALPVLVVLGLLLASSDAVFASLFHVPVDGDSILANGLLLVLGLWFAAALLRAASEPEPPTVATSSKPFGAIEAGILLAGLILLYGTFAITQLVTAMGGADHVLRTANLTAADYARSGFFQLLLVAGLTLGVLLVMKSTTEMDGSRRSRWAMVVLSEVAVVLTLVIVSVAVIRLNLYDDAFGLTMLRLYSLVAAWWLGAVFVAVGIALAGVGRSRHWLPAAVALIGLVALLGVNVIDPEAVVVRHNADRYNASQAAGGNAEFDALYAERLSDDAVPALIDALPSLEPAQQDLVLDRICGRDRWRGRMIAAAPPDRGFWGWNRSASEAQWWRAQVCR